MSGTGPIPGLPAAEIIGFTVLDEGFRFGIPFQLAFQFHGDGSQVQCSAEPMQVFRSVSGGFSGFYTVEEIAMFTGWSGPHLVLLVLGFEDFGIMSQ